MVYQGSVNIYKEVLTMPSFYLSPSRIARFFYHECERYLRYHATPRKRWKAEGIPLTSWDTSPVTAAILEGGFTWEREIIQKKLKGKVKIAPGNGPLNERAHDIKQSLSMLSELKQEEAIYQPTFKAPDSFLTRYNIPSDLCEFPPCRPDLLQLLDHNGERQLRVIDVKASTSLKVSHRIQVAMYALILRDIIQAQCPDVPLNLSYGGVWLYGCNEPEWFDLRFSIVTLEEFLSNRLHRILAAPIDELPWHLFFRCEWCEFYPHCREEADSQNSVSLIPYLSIGGRKYLRETPWGGTNSINTLSDLESFLIHPEADKNLEACGSLKSKGDRLRNAVTSIKGGDVIYHGGFSLALPIMEHVSFFLTLQDDPVTGQIYVAGYRRFKAKEVFGESIHEEVFIAETPEDCHKVRKEFLSALLKELNTLHTFNQGRDWKEQKSMQTYVFDSYELTLFNNLLQESLFDPDLSELAVQLLFHFQDTSLAEADEHPEEEVSFPIIVITGVIRQLLALPVPISFRLPEVTKVLPSPSFEYSFNANKLFWFELSNVLKSDSIFMVWNKDRKEALEWIHDEILRRLRATGAVLDGLREKVKNCLFAWPPKFLFPGPFQYNNPELSRLAFITRYESLMGAMDVRTKRTLPWTERIRDGISISLKKENGDRWKVMSEIDQSIIEEGGDFFNFLLVPEGNEGERAQLSYDDYRNRKTFWALKGFVRLAKISNHQVDPQTGLVTHLFLELKENKDQQSFVQNDKTVLHPRFTDFNSDKIIKQLSVVDQTIDNDFLQLIRTPDRFSSGVSKFSDVADSALEVAKSKAGFTASQTKSFLHVLKRQLTLIWGPPGTGNYAK
jgi:hypothetical protein